MNKYSRFINENEVFRIKIKTKLTHKCVHVNKKKTLKCLSENVFCFTKIKKQKSLKCTKFISLMQFTTYICLNY